MRAAEFPGYGDYFLDGRGSVGQVVVVLDTAGWRDDDDQHGFEVGKGRGVGFGGMMQ